MSRNTTRRPKRNWSLIVLLPVALLWGLLGAIVGMAVSR
jgi:uncharacterized membrane protein YsdA (DUF1294 family)